MASTCPLPCVMSPPCAIKSLMTRWNFEPWYDSLRLPAVRPASPVHRALKLAQVRGTISLHRM